jgi:hypothetical protein
MTVNYYLTLYPSNNISPMNENDLQVLCFKGLEEGSWGFGSKRIGIIPSIIPSIIPTTEKVSFSGFGYKSEYGVYSIGVRMWLGQGDYIKYITYDNRFTINNHFVELITQFQQLKNAI